MLLNCQNDLFLWTSITQSNRHQKHIPEQDEQDKQSGMDRKAFGYFFSRLPRNASSLQMWHNLRENIQACQWYKLYFQESLFIQYDFVQVVTTPEINTKSEEKFKEACEYSFY